MPLAALTPVLNDLLHQGNTSPAATPQSQSLQQIQNLNDPMNTNEYVRTGSISGQTTLTTINNPLSSTTSVNDVSTLIITFSLGIRTDI